MNTYQGKTATLKSFIKRRSYDEIYTETREDIWGEIYMDFGIEKSEFAPVMLNEWETYWSSLYDEIAIEVGTTSHLDKGKEQSLRQMNLLFDIYNDAVNTIKLAYDFDEMVLYPIAVLTMMRIFNPDVCYEKYCEFEFFDDDEWETICLDKDDPDSHMFFIRPYD